MKMRIPPLASCLAATCVLSAAAHAVPVIELNADRDDVDFQFNSAMLLYTATDATLTAPDWTGGVGWFGEFGTTDFSGVLNEFLSVSIRENAGNNLDSLRVVLESPDTGSGAPQSFYSFDLASANALGFTDILATSNLANPTGTGNGGADLSNVTVVLVLGEFQNEPSNINMTLESIETVVPEPGTLALGSLGALLVMRRRRSA
jgi:hypothetical protein